MKLSITVSEEVGNEFKDLATNSGVSQRETIMYLLSLHNFRVEPTGAHKVEMQLKQWLFLGHDRKITQTDLQRVTGSNLRLVKKVLEEYEAEVVEFNKQLTNG